MKKHFNFSLISEWGPRYLECNSLRVLVKSDEEYKKPFTCRQISCYGYGYVMLCYGYDNRKLGTFKLMYINTWL